MGEGWGEGLAERTKDRLFFFIVDIRWAQRRTLVVYKMSDIDERAGSIRPLVFLLKTFIQKQQADFFSFSPGFNRVAAPFALYFLPTVSTVYLFPEIENR